MLARLYDPEPYVSVAACRALGGLCAAAGDFLGGRFKGEWWGGLGRWVGRVRGEVRGRGRGLRLKGGSWGGGGRGLGLGLVGRGFGVGGVGGGGGVAGGGGNDGELLIPTRDGEVGGGDGMKLVKSSTPTSSGSLGRFTQASQVWEAALGLLTAVVAYVSIEDDMFDDILRLVVDELPRHAELREALEAVNADAVWLAMYERGMAQGRETPVVEGVEFRFAEVEAKEVPVGV